MSLPAARILPVPTTTASKLLGTGLYVVTGASFRETTGMAVAVVDLYDGRDTTGTLFASIEVASAGFAPVSFGHVGVACHVGVYASVVSGSVRGAVWAVPGQVYEGLMFARGVKPVWAGDDR